MTLQWWRIFIGYKFHPSPLEHRSKLDVVEFERETEVKDIKKVTTVTLLLGFRPWRARKKTNSSTANGRRITLVWCKKGLRSSDWRLTSVVALKLSGLEICGHLYEAALDPPITLTSVYCDLLLYCVCVSCRTFVFYWDVLCDIWSIKVLINTFCSD